MSNKHNNAPAVPQGLERYEPTVMVEESRGRLTATGAVMKPKEDGRWVRLRDLTATPAPAPAQEVADMVPRAALHEVERERDYYKSRTQNMYEHQNGEVWYWQGDGEDHPESWVNSLPVVIRADQLRELMAKPAQEMGLTDEALDNLIEDLSEWSRHVVEDTAHQTLEAHVREVLAKNPIIAALRAKGQT